MTLSLERHARLASLFSGALLLCFCIGARADDLQDAEKLYKQKQYDQALQKLDTALAAKPKDTIYARFLKGNILADMGRIEDAIGVFQGITVDAPERPEPYNNLGFLYALQGQYDKARSALEMAIRNQPTYALAHENLGDIYAKLASREYERAIQLDPNNGGTQTKLNTVKQLFPKSSSHAQTLTIPAGSAASAPGATPGKR